MSDDGQRYFKDSTVAALIVAVLLVLAVGGFIAWLTQP